MLCLTCGEAAKDEEETLEQVGVFVPTDWTEGGKIPEGAVKGDCASCGREIWIPRQVLEILLDPYQIPQEFLN
jgi:hypothetical protein